MISVSGESCYSPGIGHTPEIVFVVHVAVDVLQQAHETLRYNDIQVITEDNVNVMFERFSNGEHNATLQRVRRSFYGVLI